MPKMHPADAADREAIAQAVEFTAFLRLGPHNKIVERAATLAEAVFMADALRRAHPGRDVLVYAVLPSGRRCRCRATCRAKPAPPSRPSP